MENKAQNIPLGVKTNNKKWDIVFSIMLLSPGILIMGCLLSSVGENSILSLIRNNIFHQQEISKIIYYPYNVIFIISIGLFASLIIISLGAYFLIRNRVSNWRTFGILAGINIIQMFILLFIYFLIL